MTFRIRKEDDRAWWDDPESPYRRHLDRFPKTSDGVLWKYFYWDFFHDGCLRSVEMGPNLKTVVMRLNCPNIERVFSDGRREYLSVDFTCTFENIVHLQIERDPPIQGYDVQDTEAVFLAAEVNTSPQVGTWADRDEMDRLSSMIVQLLAHDDIIWMELVFSNLRVEPEEPVAFSLMEASPDFEVPTWSPERC